MHRYTSRSIIWGIFCVGFLLNGQSTIIADDVPEEGFEKYEARLNAVLLTHRTSEKEYISKIVKGIKDKKIPLSLVDESWLWVRDNRPRTRYPFVYFAKILKLQGERMKVKIPEFDFSIYSDRFDR